MIYFDISRSQKARHKSGLTRVSARLLAELEGRIFPVAWLGGAETPSAAAARNGVGEQDWFISAELFSEPECPGLWEFVRSRPCRLAAIFHDAIPLKQPHITWPQSVARHPEYMKMLASFDRVFAVSEASRAELLGFWEWLGVKPRARVDTIALGADFNGAPRRATPEAGDPLVLCTGILEPRKNQLFLFDVCERLWARGLEFELHIVGRVNPHFGKETVARLRSLRRRRRGVQWYDGAPDDVLSTLYRRARVSVFPTLAEGCGLPLLESLWMGVPCLCSDLPVLRENADGGGCLPVAVNDVDAWCSALERMLTDREPVWAALAAQACTRPLPTWRAAAEKLAAELRA